jgi:hypothetical protein
MADFDHLIRAVEEASNDEVVHVRTVIHDNELSVALAVPPRTIVRLPRVPPPVTVSTTTVVTPHQKEVQSLRARNSQLLLEKSTLRLIHESQYKELRTLRTQLQAEKSEKAELQRQLREAMMSNSIMKHQIDYLYANPPKRRKLNNTPASGL